MIYYKELPVYKHKEEILKSLEENQVIIIESPTGSGKTTQLPIILMEAGYDTTGLIGITQPRRIATLSICDYIKKQLSLDGNICAYTMRFSDTSDETTRIKIMTDGILLQELKSDPDLTKYSVIMVDEAHERSLNIDFILGLLYQISKRRSDIKIIISSATINTSKFSSFFDNAKIISIDAKVFPIEIIYKTPKLDKDELNKRFIKDAEEESKSKEIISIVKNNLVNKLGDILIFCSGEYEIKTYETALKNHNVYKSIQLYPLYGRLSKEEQERVFIPTEEGKIKVVIATNIAETSITIDGITTVVDLGVSKVSFYNQKDFTSALVPLPISKSSAKQRAGRAGRTQEGVCYRLYTKKSLDARPEFNEEEILRSDLAEVALRMSDLGIYDYENFPFLTKPKMNQLLSAEETLRLINAIDDKRHLTEIGKMMVEFPLLPRHSRVIVEAIMKYPEVLKEVLIATAFLSTKGPFLLPIGKEMIARSKQEKFQDEIYGDFYGYLKLFNEYSKVSLEGAKAQEKYTKQYYLDLQTMNEILHIEEQLEEIVSKMGIPITSGGTTDEYLTCLASGLVQYVCYQYKKSQYRSLTASQIYIHPGSSWFRSAPKFLLAGEIVKTSRMFARTVSPLKASNLKAIDKTLIDQLVSNKQVKAKEEKVAIKGDFIRLFDRDYPIRKSKKNKSFALIPLFDLPYIIKKAYEKGSVKKVKVLLKADKAVSALPLSLKDLIQEGSIIQHNNILKQHDDINLSLKTGDRVISDEIKILFSPIVKNNTLMFLGVRHVGSSLFSFHSYQSILNAIDDSYYALNEMKIQLNKKSDQALKQQILRWLQRIDNLVDFNA